LTPSEPALRIGSKKCLIRGGASPALHCGAHLRPSNVPLQGASGERHEIEISSMAASGRSCDSQLTIKLQDAERAISKRLVELAAEKKSEDELQAHSDACSTIRTMVGMYNHAACLRQKPKVPL